MRPSSMARSFYFWIDRNSLLIHSIRLLKDPTRRQPCRCFELFERQVLYYHRDFNVHCDKFVCRQRAHVDFPTGAVSRRRLRKGSYRRRQERGAFTLYGSHTWYRTVAKEFEKKFPFISFRVPDRWQKPHQAGARRDQGGPIYRGRHRDHRRTDGYHETGGRISRTPRAGCESIPG